MISCDHEGEIKQTQLQSADSLSYAVADKARLWNQTGPEGKEFTLNILIAGGSTENQKLVKEFASEWTKYANLKFVFHTNPEAIEHFDISVEIFEVASGEGKGGISYIGTDSKLVAKTGVSTLKLWFSPDTMVATKKGYVLHEFGHALGLQHEHQHPDRQFEFDEEKILAYCKTENWTEAECRDSKIKTFSRIDYMLFPYDDKSIMHYQLHEEHLTGVVTADALTTAKSLSLLDKLAISKIYPGKTTEEIITAEHNQKELEVLFSNDYKNCDIVEYNGAGDTQYYHKLKSKTIYEHGIFYPLDSKEDVLLNMKYDEECNQEEPVSKFEAAFADFKTAREFDETN